MRCVKEEVMSYIEDAAREVCPDWNEGGRVHNWRNYVGHRTRELWPSLSWKVRVAIALDADDRAGNEHWD